MNIPLTQAIQQVFTRLKNFEQRYMTKGYKPCIMFSGGKDSLVVLDLCHRYFGSDLYVAYIHVNGNTHEECDYYVLCTVEKYLGSLRNFYYLYRIEKVNIRGKENEPDFFEYCLEYGFPMLKKNRWCYCIFKQEVLAKLPLNVFEISGAKMFDSWIRKKYLSQLNPELPILDPNKHSSIHHDKHFNLMLIYDWEKEHVYKYIKLYNLKLNPLYGKIGHSGNCMVCPGYLSSVDRILWYLNRLNQYYPHWYSKILWLFKEFMKIHRQLVKCDKPCSKCPYLKEKNRYIYAKRIGLVLELLENDIRKYFR